MGKKERIYNHYLLLKERINTITSTSITLLFAWILDIPIGRKSIFFGRPFIHKSTKSVILIGERCRFRSLKKMSYQAGICRPCTIETLTANSEIIIGNNCGFSGAMISSALSIKIGNNVMIGANSSITDTDWHGLLPDKRAFKYAKMSPVIIEDNVWLGMNVVVLKGSKIGKNSVIASNSVVIRDIPDNVIAAGNPAKVVKFLNL